MVCKMKCFGFDTSNYTTSTAAFGDGICENVGKLLPVPESAKGLRQSDALFHHTRALPELFEELVKRVGAGADAIAVSTRPRRVEGSYMPCFLAGCQAARVLAAGLGVPLYSFSHQEGHLAAAAYAAGSLSVLEAPFLAWHLSGGTTELLYCVPQEGGGLSAERIGGTRDISAGQCVDRAGVAMGLAFPCGVELEKLSLHGDPGKLYKAKRDGLEFHLSGMENQFGDRIRRGEPPENVAAFVLKSLEEILVSATRAALEAHPGLPVLCSGGVMSCQALASRMQKEFDAKTASPALSRDNALGIALLGYLKEGGTVVAADSDSQ